MTKHEISDEQLNAFIDDELDAADRDALLTEIARDSGLAQRACALRLTKEQLRHAYAEVLMPGHRRQAGRPWRALATVAVVFAAALAGWFGHERFNPAAGMVEASALHGDTTRVILHLASGEPGQAAMALNEAESLLQTARESGQTIAVELVVNRGGLDLLRTDTSPYVKRIAGMRAAHGNLSLVACGQTVQRLNEQGVEVKLIPGVHVASSALDQIVNRMKQGWSYIRV